ANNLDKLLTVDVVVESAVEQRVGITDNAGEGRPQFMRNVSDEVLADLLQSLQIRNVVENGNHAAAGGHGERRGLRLESAGNVGEKMEAQLGRLAGGAHGSNQFVKRGITDQLQQAKALIAAAAKSDGGQECLIAERHFQ